MGANHETMARLGAIGRVPGAAAVVGAAGEGDHLDGVGDVTQASAGHGGVDAGLEGGPRRGQQPMNLVGEEADADGKGAIAEPAVEQQL